MKEKKRMLIVRDSREKEGKGWQFRASPNCYGMEVRKLNTGDYSLAGYENLVMIERKTIEDLWGTLVMHRERFYKEMDRALSYPARYLIIEGTMADVLNGCRYSKVSPATILGILTSLEIKYGLHVIYTSRRTDVAQEYVRKLLYKLFEYCNNGVISGTADNTGGTPPDILSAR